MRFDFVDKVSFLTWIVLITPEQKYTYKTQIFIFYINKNPELCSG